MKKQKQQLTPHEELQNVIQSLLNPNNEAKAYLEKQTCIFSNAAMPTYYGKQECVPVYLDNGILHLRGADGNYYKTPVSGMPIGSVINTLCNISAFPVSLDELLSRYNAHLSVTSREWFDKAFGNSYFATIARFYVTINGVEIEAKKIVIPFLYGYGSHSLDVCKEKLLESYGIARNFDTLDKYFSRYGREDGRDHKITYSFSKKDNCLKRELAALTAGE